MKQQHDSKRLPWHKTRRMELDWLRVIAFGILILYHVGMLYAFNWDWHYKSTYTSTLLPKVMMWSNQWRMSLLFLISGVAVSYLLHTMPHWVFFRSRWSKIFLPLVFGMTVVVVPQVYVEMSSKGLLKSLSYPEFWLAYLDQTSPIFNNAKTLGQIHLTWNHLWFLAYVFCYSLILWGVYPVLTSVRLSTLWRYLNTHTPLWSVVAVPILAYYVNGFLLWERYPTTHTLWGDWFNHGKCFTSFILGFALVRSTRLWESMVRLRWLVLLGGIATYSYTLFATNGGRFGEGVFSRELNGFLWSANAWLWILTVIAWAQHKLMFTSTLVKYLNGGVFCFYILHQTVILLLAYYLVPMKLGALNEAVLVILGTAVTCWFGYELLRLLPALSILMGVKQNNLRRGAKRSTFGYTH